MKNFPSGLFRIKSQLPDIVTSFSSLNIKLLRVQSVHVVGLRRKIEGSELFAGRVSNELNGEIALIITFVKERRRVRTLIQWNPSPSEIDKTDLTSSILGNIYRQRSFDCRRQRGFRID